MAAADLTHPHPITRAGFERAITCLTLDELGDLSDSLAALAACADRIGDRDFAAECDERYGTVCREVERRPEFRQAVERTARYLAARRQP